MKTGPEPHDEDRLLDAILADDGWTETSSRIRNEGLREMRRAKWEGRVPTLLRCAAVVAVLFALITTVIFSGNRPATGDVKTASPAPKMETIDDNELLAMLPEGSAVVAQVNGETVLVFLDPEVEAAFAR